MKRNNPWDLKKYSKESRDQNPIVQYLGDNINYSATTISEFSDFHVKEIPEFDDFAYSISE